MRTLENYQIIQRDADGYANVPFSGELPKNYEEKHVFMSRVVNELDSSVVVDYVKCEVKDGRWSTVLRVPEGGLYRFETIRIEYPEAPYNWSERIACVFHVGVGDIYVLAGQSNMTGYGRGPAYDPPCLGVHSFCNDGTWQIAVHPLAGSMKEVFNYPENCSGTSPALSFARRLHERIGVPIGIIPAAIGGSPLREWIPEETGNFYRGMMKRLEIVGKVKGILWYQGCSDADEENIKTYYDRFTHMVEVWRREIGDPDLPFLTVQLNRYSGNNDTHWGAIRDAQRRAALNIPGVYIVSAIDLPLSDAIHNCSHANVVIGERLADTALAKVYGKPGYNCCPCPTSAEYIDETSFLVRYAEPGFYCYESVFTGIDTEDENGLIPSSAGVTPEGLVIHTSRPYTLPAKFHMLWRCQPPAIVALDAHGLPSVACYNLEIEKK